jgi:hypothetical protein
MGASRSVISSLTDNHGSIVGTSPGISQAPLVRDAIVLLVDYALLLQGFELFGELDQAMHNGLHVPHLQYERFTVATFSLSHCG